MLIYIKRIIAYVICSPIIGKLIHLIYNGKIPHRGSIIQVPNIGDPSISAFLYWGMYESAEIRFINKYLLNDVDIIELGSSLGGVSCEILRKMSKEVSFFGLEANPNIYELLKKNVLRNSGGKKINFLNAAIDYSGKDQIFLSIGNSNLSSKVAIENAENAVHVGTITLSQIIELQRLEEFILIADIEGAELGILLHDINALTKCKQLIIELHETNYNGVSYLIMDLVDLIINNTNMRVIDCHDNVFIFEKTLIKHKQ